MPRFSIRGIAKALDPVGPALRLSGAATDDPDLDTWYRTRDADTAAAAALRAAIRSTCSEPVGLIEHEDRGLSQLHRWTPRQRRAREHRSSRAMCARHSEPSTRTRLLAYNTWLIDPPVGEKPLDREARVGEIGRALNSGGFDVMALGEVFKERDREAIRGELSFTHKSVRGPGRSGVETNSGLQTIVRSPPLAVGPPATWVFRNTGFPDSLAQKGVLYTEIDLGPGRIDLFLTHMYAPGADKQGLSDVRRRQTIELGMFVQEQRKPGNVVVVVGDLNVDGRKSEYRRLLQMMYTRQRGRIRLPVAPTVTQAPGPAIVRSYDFELKLQDAWLSRGSSFGATVRVSEYSKICRVDEDGYCDDHRTDGASRPPDDREPGYRLDYVFIEEPSDQHSFNLDLTRIRRRPFWRPGFPKDAFTHTRPVEVADLAPGSNLLSEIERSSLIGVSAPVLHVPNYLSDHLGLEVTLIASPRADR